MLNLSESYKSKLQILAGIITEAEEAIGNSDMPMSSGEIGWEGSEQRVSGYDEAMMIEAIKTGIISK